LAVRRNTNKSRRAGCPQPADLSKTNWKSLISTNRQTDFLNMLKFNGVPPLLLRYTTQSAAPGQAALQQLHIPRTDARWAPLRYFNYALCIVNYALNIKSEQNDISVLHNVFLTLGTDKTFFLCCSHCAASHKVIEGHNLCSDEASFKV